jgi:hypothetical protein
MNIEPDRINHHIFGIDRNVWFFGVVENRDDPLMLGRLQVRIVGLHPDDKTLVPTEDLPWAAIVMPMTNSHAFAGTGMSPVGAVIGTQVIGFFLDGMDRQQPILMGTLPSGTGHFDVGVNQPSSSYTSPTGSLADSAVGTVFAAKNLSSSIIGRGAGFAKFLLGDMNKNGFAIKDHHAAAIMGNLAGESGLLAIAEGHHQPGPPPPINNHKGGYGFAQWTASRLTSYLTYCQSNRLDPQSDEGNMRYLCFELRTSFKPMIQALASGGTHSAVAAPKGPHNVDVVQGATCYVLGQYERPTVQNATNSAPKRVGYAQNILAGMSKATVPVNGTGTVKK